MTKARAVVATSSSPAPTGAVIVAAVEAALALVEAIPRCGWAAEDGGWTAAPALAAQIGVRSLTIARDDRLQPLGGGSKVRKLDYLLAAPPLQDAAGWCSVGAIGSGHLVACTAAALQTGRAFDAVVFWEPISAGVLDHLAYVASHARTLTCVPHRAALLWRAPAVLLGLPRRGVPTLPPGGTTGVGMIGAVRAGLRLGAAVAAGELAAPAAVVVALGSGGMATGLARGIALAGLTATRVIAVATVERPLATRARLRRLDRALAGALVAAGAGALAAPPPAPIVLVRDQVGPGYGHPTPASNAAVAAAAPLGVALEPVYTGKALAALLAPGAAARWGVGEGDVVLWHTARGPTALPAAADWQQRLPAAWRARVRAAEAAQDGDLPRESSASRAAVPGPRQWSRRRLLGTAAVAGAALTGATWRLASTRPWPGWTGSVLSAREATVLEAIATACLPPAPALAPGEIARGADRMLTGAPAFVRQQARAALVVVEQATPAGGAWRCLSALAPAEAEAALGTMASRGGTLAAAVAGVRDLMMAAAYQHPAMWPSLGYEGPWVAASPRPRRAAYARLEAPAGAMPRALAGAG